MRVLAVVEKGHLSAKTLISAKKSLDCGDELDLPTYVSAMVAANIANGGNSTKSIETRSGWTPLEQNLLKTEWHQWAPFNTVCCSKIGFETPVGCVALALGQILAYNKAIHNVGPSMMYKPGFPQLPYSPRWTQITQAIETALPAAINEAPVAEFLYQIGKAVGMVYYRPYSLATPENAASFLSTVAGYKNVEFA